MSMITTRLAYDGSAIVINPYTISYILTNELHETTIVFTNGHSLPVSASILELKEAINNETKSLCKECKTSLSSS